MTPTSRLGVGGREEAFDIVLERMWVEVSICLRFGIPNLGVLFEDLTQPKVTLPFTVPCTFRARTTVEVLVQGKIPDGKCGCGGDRLELSRVELERKGRRTNVSAMNEG